MFIPLTKEQYQKARNAGFTHEKIIEMEKRRKEMSVAQPKKEPSYMERVGESSLSGIEQIKKDITSPTDTRSALSRGISATSNAFGVITSPIMEAPGFKQVGELINKGINFAGEQLSNLYPKDLNQIPEAEFQKATQPLQDVSNLGNIANTILLTKGVKETASSVKKGITQAGPIVNKAKATISNLGKKDYNSAIDSLNKSYKTAFVNDQVAVNKQLTKFGSIIGKSPDELVRSLVEEGIIPQVEGKLAKFDNSLTELTNRQNQIAQATQKTLKTIKIPTSLNDFKSSLFKDIKETAAPAELTKSLAEAERTIESYRLKYGDTLMPENLGEIRISANDATKAFDRAIFETDVSNSIGNVVRKRLDHLLPDKTYRMANAEWGRIADLKRVIQVFDNKPINIGVLGGQLGRLAGALTLGGVALPFSGPGSLVIAGIAATYGGDFIANFLRNRKFNVKTQNIIKESLKNNPDILIDLIKESNDVNSKYFIKLLEESPKLLEKPKPGTPQSQINTPINLPKESGTTFEKRQIEQIQSQLKKSK